VAKKTRWLFLILVIVLTSCLGKGNASLPLLCLEEYGEYISYTKSNLDGNIIKGVLTLKARAFPLKAVTGVNGSQTVYIVVQDQRLLPISNAQITLLVRMPGGEENRYIVPDLSDANGITHYVFPFNTTSVGIAKIYATITFNNIQVQTVTSFRIWW
jgi:hypothetical protein